MSRAREMGEYVKIATTIACIALLADILMAVMCCRNAEYSDLARERVIVENSAHAGVLK